jgi:hypothetical protein
MTPEQRQEFDAAIESFPWSSEDQRQGYLALVQYLRRFGLEPKLPINYEAAFFIEKDIDSHAYWRDMVGAQVRSLEDVLSETRKELDSARAKVDQMEMTMKAMMLNIDALNKRLLAVQSSDEPSK